MSTDYATTNKCRLAAALFSWKATYLRGGKKINAILNGLMVNYKAFIKFALSIYIRTTTRTK